MDKIKDIIFILAIIFIAANVQAQPAQDASYPLVPTQTGGGSISATQTSAKAALGSGEQVYVKNSNDSANSVYVVLGVTGDSAGTSGFPLEPGDVAILSRNASVTHIHGVCASSETATLLYATGDGF